MGRLSGLTWAPIVQGDVIKTHSGIALLIAKAPTLPDVGIEHAHASCLHGCGCIRSYGEYSGLMYVPGFLFHGPWHGPLAT